MANELICTTFIKRKMNLVIKNNKKICVSYLVKDTGKYNLLHGKKMWQSRNS